MLHTCAIPNSASAHSYELYLRTVTLLLVSRMSASKSRRTPQRTTRSMCQCLSPNWCFAIKLKLGTQLCQQFLVSFIVTGIWFNDSVGVANFSCIPSPKKTSQGVSGCYMIITLRISSVSESAVCERVAYVISDADSHGIGTWGPFEAHKSLMSD